MDKLGIITSVAVITISSWDTEKKPFRTISKLLKGL